MDWTFKNLVSGSSTDESFKKLCIINMYDYPMYTVRLCTYIIYY